MNRVYLMGYVGNEPNLQTSTKGKPYTQLNIATHRRYQLESGEWEAKTDWHRVHVYGRRAETCVKYLQKGQAVFVEGEIQAYRWVDDKGNTNKNFSITAQSVEFFSPPRKQETAS